MTESANDSSLVSIIVPVYNVAPYLGQCIESLLLQTHRMIEVILVDDGSTDNSQSLCDEYAKKDSRVSVIHKENEGLGAARNTGLKAAKGTYVSFVDGDDIVAPCLIEVLLYLLKSYNADIGTVDLQRFCSDSIPTQRNNYQEFGCSCLDRNSYIEYLLLHGFSACAKLYNRKAIDGCLFHEGVLHEDLFWQADMLKIIETKVVQSNQQLYYYRQHGTSIMAQSKRKCSPDRVIAGEYLYKTVLSISPENADKAFRYAISYPWSFVDPVYVDHSFCENRELIALIQAFLRDNILAIKMSNEFTKVQKHRMRLFAFSRALYGVNAYARLIRVFLYRILGRDAYRSGHGI